MVWYGISISIGIGVGNAGPWECFRLALPYRRMRSPFVASEATPDGCAYDDVQDRACVRPPHMPYPHHVRCMRVSTAYGLLCHSPSRF
jgi:hypothetical protein